MNIGMGVQPRLHSRYFVNRQIIQNQMDLAALPTDHGLVQKPHECFAGMSSGAALTPFNGRIRTGLEVYITTCSALAR
jgi:hypothetical protein